jgi:pimeloyl-ACP methyl ester carboxylesterase
MEPESPIKPTPGAVFLSYAAQDAEAGRRICEALGAAGIEVWFDRSELRGGDVWDRKIREQIHQCRLFMPIISVNTEARVEGYFRREWKLAVDRTHDRSERVAFLVPVAIDSTREQDADVPDAFRHVQWTRLPGGETPQGLVERIRRLLTPEGSSATTRARAPESNVATSTLTPPGVVTRQRIQYVRTADGTRLAWAQAGAGQPLVKAANWLTHLEYDWTSPVWRHWIQFFSTHFQFTRYDERGCGMSEWRAGALTIEEWTADLELVISTAQIDSPITLLGISQGAAACIQYAVRHPERVARMILYGGYARGAFWRGDVTAQRAYRAMVELAETSWESSNSAFRQVFTSRFIPGATPEQLQWFNELCTKSTAGEVAGKLLHARAELDIRELLPQVRSPTLVLHSRNDEVVPISEGQCLATEIEGAEFVELDSRNHVLLEHEPAWLRFQHEILAFARQEP